jgi:hypothetical protein
MSKKLFDDSILSSVLSLKFAQQACRLLMVSVPEGPNVYNDGCQKIFAPAERNVSRFRRQIALRSARGVS